jgi:enterochelin esterase-like enzyme
VKRVAFPLLALSALLAFNIHAQPAAGIPTRRGNAARAEAQWVTPPVSGPGLHHATFDSKAAGTKVSYLIYLPEAYEMKKDERFPVVFWLHGLGGSQKGVPRMCGNFTAAITQGKMPPAIVVFANGMVDGFYNDAIHAPRPVETVIIKELVPHIDSTYRTIARREARMIEGFSMGGYGAGHLGFKYPELFGSVSMIDAAMVDLNVMKTRHADIFQRIFDGKEETFNDAHPLMLAEKNVAQIKGRTLIRQVVGALVGPNAVLHEKMTRLGIAHDYVLFEGVGHNLGAIYEGLGDNNWAFYAKAFKPTNPIEKSSP